MEELLKAGVFIDEIYTVRVELPNLSSSKKKFKQECFKYSKAFTIFKKFVFNYCNISKIFAEDVDKEKLRAIGTQNQLKTAFIQRQSMQQVYQYEIFEQTVELDRLKGELQFLQRIETEQHEIINSFFVNQY
ncbi:intraflagellar transport protein 20 homolog [Drosophila santomea]|uniref:intraflagellar transport protein 20 homolog n=1 Tax=Drosophila santomea TaxID=129105 RepID=UPI00195365A9|nr:intraflagellar transport protein 20 homolog [Drosophila santomea]